MSFKIQRGLFQFDLTDHHAILGVPVTADPNQVRKRYLNIARSLHPDACKLASDSEKHLASEILSKLVNPAYETLKGKTLAEYQIVLAQTGKRLATEGNLAVEGEAAKALVKASGNIDVAYQNSLQNLAANQYKSINQIIENIAQISELNTVYLMKKEGQGVRSAPAGSKSVPPPPPPSSKTPTSQGAPSPGVEEKKAAPSDSGIRRANEYMTKGNFAKAVLELREALKIDPNNSAAHSLIGLAYLKQSQVSMAKVHINKALQINPQEPMALKLKDAIDKQNSKTPAPPPKSAPAAGKKPPDKPSSSGGMFGGMFGGKKK